MFSQKPSRYIFCVVTSALVFVGFTARLIDWQIVNGDLYYKKANQNNTFVREIKASRGQIVDVNGEGLAVNTSGHTLALDRFYIKDEKLNQTIEFLLDLFKKKNEKWEDILPISVDKNGNYSFLQDDTSNANDTNKNKIEKEISILKGKNQLNLNNYATASDCMKKLIEKYDCQAYSPQKARDIISVRYNMTKDGSDSSAARLYTFARNISQDIIVIVKELSDKFPGIDVIPSTVREYKNGAIAPHIIGYTGSLSSEDYDELKEKGYKLDDCVGKMGIEKVMEQYLRGKNGKTTIETNRRSEVIAQTVNEEAIAGNTVFLTIDSNLQKTANESLEKTVKLANRSSSSCICGAAVVLNVKDFSVLAAATYPSFDLTKFVSDQQYLDEIANDKKYLPMQNRAFREQFVPGSIFKPMMACTALQEGIITPDTCVGCYGGWHLPGSDGSGSIKCHNHSGGSVNLLYALTVSCNSYFADIGYKTGIDKIELYGKRFGLGVKTGIELTEVEGLIASASHRKSLGMTWSPMDSAMAGFGQSDHSFSPLQLATYTATLAGGGKRYKTHLIRKVTDYARNEIIMENNPDSPELVENTGIEAKHIECVKAALHNVTVSGTARFFANFKPSLAAKTGTAQTGTDNDHSTFICFGPYENPEIAIAVVIPYAGSATTSARNVTSDILNAYFHKV